MIERVALVRPRSRAQPDDDRLVETGNQAAQVLEHELLDLVLVGGPIGNGRKVKRLNLLDDQHMPATWGQPRVEQGRHEQLESQRSVSDAIGVPAVPVVALDGAKEI